MVNGRYCGSLVPGVDGYVLLCERMEGHEGSHRQGDTEWVMAADPVNHPAHYTGHPSGVECITITEHMGFCIGNAVKYLWRADLKGNALEDLEKARWYVDREIAKRKAASA